MSQAIPDVIRPLRPGAATVNLDCPHCNAPGVHSAKDWPQINVDDVFIISTNVAYGITCSDCQGTFCWKPAAAVQPWPPGNTMTVQCPGCASTVSTQIDMARELDEPLRPEECDECATHFIVFPDGKTELPAACPSGSRRADGRQHFESITFDPNGHRDWPFTTEVEGLLTVPWLHQFEDGTQQFIDDDLEPVLVYSPRLAPEDLERFCEAHVERYRTFHTTHSRALDRRERVSLACFWQEQL